ncbi:MAG: hypothetical protein ABI947_23950 [Chloroflexota bacterium]
MALVQLLPREVDSRLTNMALLMVGIFGSRSVQTGRLAANRCVSRSRVSCDGWSVFWITERGGSPLVWDSTKVSAHHRLLLVGIAYRQRVIPLAWTWVRSSRGHSRTSLQIALLSYVHSLLPAGVRVSLVGDCEFGHRPVLWSVQGWGLDYVLRQSGQQLVGVENEPDWLRLDALLPNRGTWRFVGDVCLTASAQVLPICCWPRRSAILRLGCWRPI